MPTGDQIQQHWSAVSREYDKDPGVYTDTTYQISSKKGGRLMFNIASLVNTVGLYSPPYERKLSDTNVANNKNGVIWNESSVRLGGQNAGSFYYHGSSAPLQDIALGGYQKTLFDNSSYMGGTTTRSPWGFYSVAHPWYLLQYNAFYVDPLAYIYSRPEDGKRQMQDSKDFEAYRPDVYTQAGDSKAKIEKATEEGVMENAKKTSYHDRSRIGELQKMYPMPEASDALTPNEFSGDFFLERIAATRHEFRRGPTYTWASQNDEYIRGFVDNVYYPRDTSMGPPLTGIQQSLNSLSRRQWQENSKGGATSSYTREQAVGNRIFMDQYRFVSENETSIQTMPTLINVFGSHYVETNGVNLQSPKSIKFNESYPMSPSNFSVQTDMFNERWFFSERMDYHRGGILEVDGVYSQLCVDDDFLLAPTVLYNSNVAMKLQNLGGLWCFWTGISLYVTPGAAHVEHSRYSAADFLFDTLGFLTRLLTMVTQVASVATRTVLGLGIKGVKSGVLQYRTQKIISQGAGPGPSNQAIARQKQALNKMWKPWA